MFGGSDEPTDTHDEQHVSKEVDAFVYHVRPRLRRKVLAPARGFGAGGGGGAGGGISSIAQPQPSSSQTPVVSDDAALSQWHERAMAKEVVAHMALVESAQERRIEAARAAPGGRGSLDVAATEVDEIRGRRAPDKRTRSSEHQQGSEIMLAAALGMTAVWDAIPLAQPERALPSSQWIMLNKSPVRPYGVEVRACCAFCLMFDV